MTAILLDAILTPKAAHYSNEVNWVVIPLIIVLAFIGLAAGEKIRAYFRKHNPYR